MEKWNRDPRDSDSIEIYCNSFTPPTSASPFCWENLVEFSIMSREVRKQISFAVRWISRDPYVYRAIVPSFLGLFPHVRPSPTPAGSVSLGSFLSPRIRVSASGEESFHLPKSYISIDLFVFGIRVLLVPSSQAKQGTISNTTTTRCRRRLSGYHPPTHPHRIALVHSAYVDACGCPSLTPYPVIPREHFFHDDLSSSHI
ncbi:hypothetical protein F5146DRAFT_555660 [Armillaria mellea]|nr:hypothetical protein F5146DRAFT_555660 [Armillaria mellea]